VFTLNTGNPDMNLEETNALRLEGVRENSTDGPLLGTNVRPLCIQFAVKQHSPGTRFFFKITYIVAFLIKSFRGPNELSKSARL